VVVHVFFVFAVLASPYFLLTLNRLHRKRADRRFSPICNSQERQGVSFVDSAAAEPVPVPEERSVVEVAALGSFAVASLMREIRATAVALAEMPFRLSA
jgi:hypothetical protein